MDKLLPVIDEQLARTGMPLHARPLTATKLFRQTAITDVSPSAQGPETETEWFAVVYWHVEHWYRAAYVDERSHGGRSIVPALFEWHTKPCLLSVPLTVGARGPQPGTDWLHFPLRVLAHEDRLKWVQVGPKNVPSLRRGLLRRRIAAPANALRTVNLSLVVAKFQHDSQRALAGTVLAHLGAAADYIHSLDAGRIALAAWELHLAIEKVIKVYLMQHQVRPGTTHRLSELLEAAAKNKLPVPRLANRLARLPSDKDAIAYRYAELGPRLPAKALRDYRLVLSVARAFALQLTRDLHLGRAGFSILLQRPPWMRYPQP